MRCSTTTTTTLVPSCDGRGSGAPATCHTTAPHHRTIKYAHENKSNTNNNNTHTGSAVFTQGDAHNHCAPPTGKLAADYGAVMRWLAHLATSLDAYYWLFERALLEPEPVFAHSDADVFASRLFDAARVFVGSFALQVATPLVLSLKLRMKCCDCLRSRFLWTRFFFHCILQNPTLSQGFTSDWPLLLNRQEQHRDKNIGRTISGQFVLNRETQFFRTFSWPFSRSHNGYTAASLGESAAQKGVTP